MSERGPVIPEGSRKVYDRFHYSPAYQVGDTLYVSGVIGAGDDIAAEFESAFASLADVLSAAGFSLDDVVEMTSYHVGLHDTVGPFMAARDAVMSEPWPAWTAIGCTELAMPNGRVEIKVTAVRS